GLFANTIRDLTLQTLPREGQYAFLAADAERLFGELGRATDPTVIQNLAGFLDDTIRRAFGLLSPEEQSAMLGGFVSELERARELTAERLDVAQDDISTQLGQTLGQVTTDFNAIVDRLRDEVVAPMAAAADAQLMAARTPQQVNLNLGAPSFDVTPG
ncbi:MAG: hypothetical protein IT521_02420, partial [Burkholderiales bacterium]|nr:hypothetical protein [Burkholderiales bacterium]